MSDAVAARPSNVVPFRSVAPKVIHSGIVLSDHVVDTVVADEVKVRYDDPSSLALKDELWRDLAKLGVGCKPNIFRRFWLEEIALALEDVRDQLRAGARLYNPGGVFIRTLERNTGRKVYT